jgi:hypothetical protein
MPTNLLDFRALAAGGEWLRATWARPFGYAYMRGDWIRVFDGMIYTHQDAPQHPRLPLIAWGMGTPIGRGVPSPDAPRGTNGTAAGK